MSDGPTDVETELDRDIGIVGAISLGVGTMIAAGIFVLSGLAVSNVGTMAIVSFVIAAVVASFTAFAYAEFASIYPESGGGYAYVSNTFDTDLTYIVGATREGLLQQLVFGAIPETVGREAPGTVIMAKRDLGITTRIRRLLSRG